MCEPYMVQVEKERERRDPDMEAIDVTRNAKHEVLTELKARFARKA